MVKVFLSVGTKFYVGDNLLIVEECDPSVWKPSPCDGCYFYETYKICSCPLYCTDTRRRDRKDVIFKKVEEKK